MIGKDFIILWAGTDYQEAYYITLLLIVPAAIPLMQSLGVDIQRALNKHQIRSVVYTGLSVANILIGPSARFNVYASEEVSLSV